jgi:hypothetical protein
MAGCVSCFIKDMEKEIEMLKDEGYFEVKV